MSSLSRNALEHNTEETEREFPPQPESIAMNQSTPSTFLEIGIDLSKDKLDVIGGGPRRSYANNRQGIDSLLDELQRCPGPLRVSCEATGGYSRLLIASCLRADIPVSLLNPREVRSLARASGRLAKTDELDAELIARFAKTFNPSCLDHTWFVRQQLSQLLQRRDFLISSRARCKASLDSYEDPSIKAEIRREIRALDRRIDSYQEKIDSLIQADEHLARKRAALSKVTGVGPAVSVALLITLPELGSLNRNQAAALTGLAPINRDSGRMRGKRMIQAGRPRPRRALYMAALSASRFHPGLSEFYRQLRERGKPAKVALTAVARKLAILLNTNLKQLAET